MSVVDENLTIETIKKVPKNFKLTMHIQHSSLPNERKSWFSIGDNALELYSENSIVYLKLDLTTSCQGYCIGSSAYGTNPVVLQVFKPKIYKFQTQDVPPSQARFLVHDKAMQFKEDLKYADHRHPSANWEYVGPVAKAEYKLEVTLTEQNQVVADTIYIDTSQCIYGVFVSCFDSTVRNLGDDRAIENVNNLRPEESNADIKLMAESGNFLHLKNFALLSLDGFN